MELEFFKESIKNCIEIRKNFWTALLGLVASLLALLITPTIIIPLKAVLLLVDIFFIVIVMLTIHFSNTKINEYLKEIRGLK